MTRANLTITNTVGGELSPRMHGRVDLPVYKKGLTTCRNFICMPTGGARFRNGSYHVKSTRLNKTGKLIPFQFNDSQAYLIESTDLKFRFFKDNAAIVETAKVITGVTQANPGVVTSASHGFSNGDEVYIDSIAGMTRLNGRFFLVAGAAANTFTLTDISGNAIDTTSLTAYSSGGTVSRVYEIASPYDEVDVPYVQFAQNADTMYLTHQNYEPRKLTRTGHASWSLATFVRTADPFTPTTKTITAVTQANPGVVTSAAHGMQNGMVIVISGIVGMTQLNGNRYIVDNVTTNTFTLKANTAAGTAVDTTAYTAYSSGGTATLADKYPRSVTFTDTGRLLYGGTRANPETLFASKAPTSGATAFDNFTTGTGATDALIFTLVPAFGRVDSIQWLSNTSKQVIAGTFGAIRRIYGATEQEPLSPSSVTAKAVNGFGCSNSLPVANGSNLFYIQRGDKLVRSLEYDISIDGYTTVDRNLVADHLTKPGCKQIIEQQGDPDMMWVTRNDGRLLGLTFKDKEDISGWHQHFIGGRHVNSSGVTMPFAKVLWAEKMARPGNYDQLWMIVERTIGGVTKRSVEYITDAPLFPLRTDFYNDSDNESGDATDYMNALYETQKDSNHLDMAVSYDGSAYATMTMTPGAGATVAETTGVTFTAGSAVFTAAMVGREIWKKYDITGNGGGRARITGYTNSTTVTCEILSAFDSTSAIAAGGWYLTATNISGLDHLEGETVYVVADGAVAAEGDAVVTNGAITLENQASKVTVGYFQEGIVETLNLDVGGVSGSAQAKVRNLIKIAIRFLNSLGCKFGSSLYTLQNMEFGTQNDLYSRPDSLFSGVQEQAYSDSSEFDSKKVIVVQGIPAPCFIESIDAFLKTTDE